MKAIFDLGQAPDLVDVEEETREVTDEEGHHDEDENNTEVRLLLLLPLPQLVDFPVNSDVDNGEDGEGTDPQDDQLGGAVVGPVG